MRRKALAWAAGLLIFLVAFLPRALHTVSRSPNWHERAFEFAGAVRYGHWDQTYLQHHPGVTTMWVAGPPMFLYARHVSPGVETFLVERLGLPQSETGQQVTLGVIALAFVISLGIVAGGWLMRSLFDWRAGLAASLMMALGPPFLSSSKQLHVDALMTIFMLLSALLVLRYVRDGSWRWLILSGFAGGLALLTKVPALFLLPYSGLALLVGSLWSDERPRLRDLPGLTLREIALPMAVWTGVAAITYVALWPAMWVNPFETLLGVWGGLTLHTRRPHPSAMYFAGRVTGADPGFWFYVATLLLEPTFVSLTLALASLVIFVVWRDRPQVRRGAPIYWMLVAFLFFFWLQMTLAAKKQTRYLLPSMVMLDVLAGVGLARLADLVRLRISRGWAGGLIALGLALQAGLVLPRHPDYGTYYNDLLGGAQVAAYYLPIGWWGEGADRLVGYLEARSEITPDQAVWAPYRIYGMIERRYNGTMDVYGLHTAPWLAFDVNNVVREKYKGKDWEPYWEAAIYREPETVIAYDGLPYLWLYRNDLLGPLDPSALRHPLEAELDGGLRLLGYEVNAYLGRIRPGETLRGTLFVEGGGGGEVEVGLVGQDGEPVATGRAQPERPVGEVVRTPFKIQVPDEARGGAHQLAVRGVDGGWLRLANLEVQRLRPTPVTVLAWLWTVGLTGLLTWLILRAGAEPEQ